MPDQRSRYGLGDKTVLITGGSKGIGQAVALRMAEAGCNLVLAARSREALETVKSAIQKTHPVAIDLFAGDLADPGTRDALVNSHPDVDILVNSAGAIPGGDLNNIDEARWREGWDLKVFGYIELCRRYYGSMTERGAGVIVNIIGAAGQVPDANYICGSTGNAALMMFTRTLGGVTLDQGVRVVGINPGLVSTDRMVTLLKGQAKRKFDDESRWRELTAHLPAGRAAQADEIASACVFLASPDASYISGTILTVDGGYSSRGSNF
ncbi:MAG: SDR family oxidoreductase [Fimbriimonadaceae bacterium]|nr:SDR family oxidoreductase [Alphaproteobacteria bacterium]